MPPLRYYATLAESLSCLFALVWHLRNQCLVGIPTFLLDEKKKRKLCSTHLLLKDIKYNHDLTITFNCHVIFCPLLP